MALTDVVENILKADDLEPGSFGTLEKGIGYSSVLCMILPILITPLLNIAVRRNILKLTLVLLSFLVFLLLVIRFRFSWIMQLSVRLQRFF